MPVAVLAPAAAVVRLGLGLLLLVLLEFPVVYDLEDLLLAPTLVPVVPGPRVELEVEVDGFLVWLDVVED